MSIVLWRTDGGALHVHSAEVQPGKEAGMWYQLKERATVALLRREE